MKFITFNFKTILVIFALISAIAFISVNSSELTSKLKSNSQVKNLSKSLLKTKTTSKLNSKAKKYSLTNPPGAKVDLNPEAKVTGAKDTQHPNVISSNPNSSAQVKTVVATKGTGDVIFNDWFSISSADFHSHFEEIHMGEHGDNIRIRVDSYDFRINDAFSKDKNVDNQPPTEELFWFRITKEIIFYSSTKHDLNLLGSMKISDIVEYESDTMGSNGSHCFKIMDAGNHKWEVCSIHVSVRNTWFCKIQELRKDTLPAYCAGGSSTIENTKIVVKNVRIILF